MDQDKQKEIQKRVWLGGKEVGGSGPHDIVETSSGKYLVRSGKYHKIVPGKYGATEIEGIGVVKRDSRNKIISVGEEKVEGDLEL